MKESGAGILAFELQTAAKHAIDLNLTVSCSVL